MVMRYRTTDVAQWGAGIGANLTPAQVDENFWTLYQMIQTITVAQAVSIDHITVSGSQFTITLTDATVQGPFDLPQNTWAAKGAWLPATVYARYDVVSNGTKVYLVNVAHTSEASFSEGHTVGGDFAYLPIITMPNWIPAGGTTGQKLVKTSNADYAIGWSSEVNDLPVGGTLGQILAKASGTNYDVEWIDAPTGSGSGLTTRVETTRYYDLQLTDAGKVIIHNPTAWGEVIVPSDSIVNFPTGTVIGVVMGSEYITEFTDDASGVVVTFPNNKANRLKRKGSIAWLLKTGPNSWSVAGELCDKITVHASASGTITLDNTTANIHQFNLGGDLTIQLADPPWDSSEFVFIFKTRATADVVTFGTFLLNAGTLTVTAVANRYYVVRFATDGEQTYFESSRTGPLTA